MIRGQAPRAPRVDKPREKVINQVPREVIEAAFAAFDARHPGVEVLTLVDDTREGGEEGEHVLCFGSVDKGTATVVATVTPKDDSLRVSVAVPDGDDLTLTLEQLAPPLRLVRPGPMPAVFGAVSRGLVSIMGARSAAPVWCTEWLRL